MKKCQTIQLLHISGADSGFLVGGGANIQICQIYPKNYLKLRKFRSVVCVGGTPLDPPLSVLLEFNLWFLIGLITKDKILHMTTFLFQNVSFSRI